MPTTPTCDRRPLTVALVNDHEILLHGLTLMLSPRRHRVMLTTLDSRVAARGPIDIALIDTDRRARREGCDIANVLDGGNVGKAVVHSWAPPAELDQRRLQRASGSLSKGLGAIDLVAGLERVHYQKAPVVIHQPQEQPSVKSYVRTADRKIEVTSRSQAVLRGLQHGLGPAHPPGGQCSNVLPLVTPPRRPGPPVTLQPHRYTS